MKRMRHTPEHKDEIKRITMTTKKEQETLQNPWSPWGYDNMVENCKEIYTFSFFLLLSVRWFVLKFVNA